ncbi:hypothetical protein Prudu_013975 [Prunus dulcis]|uniref:Uncharacterized protein n=1 Tax=Prunus dulcis TaxID=3755 RepID=A0A4Y1RG89_PRUDU|nr:hypothetical protein Prudu_013975 [Prunus dulcis]
MDFHQQTEGTANILSTKSNSSCFRVSHLLSSGRLENISLKQLAIAFDIDTRPPSKYFFLELLQQID